MLTKIISGSQTGADVAGLIAAKNYGLETGGYVLSQNKTELGNMPELIKVYSLTEINSTQYPTRTLMNVQVSDGTVIFYYNKLERGSKLTQSYCERLDKPCLPINMLEMYDNTYGFMLQELRKFINQNNIKTLNVAGNRESISRGIQEKVIFLLTKTFEIMYNEKELKKV